MKIYILQSEQDLFLNKDLEWTAAADANTLFSSAFKDVALNQLIELNAKDISLRARVVTCDADSRGRPILVDSNQSASNQDQPSTDAA